MKTANRKFLTLFMAVMTAFTVSCASAPPAEESTSSSGTTRGDARPGNQQTQSQIDNFDNFAQTHDSFTTTLAREENDNDSIPAPPEGLFDLVSYPSKVGDLAAYISSDPGDGQKHPMILWVVGGWGNGIDDFPWCYPEWDNDQTASAFWQEGLLAMYPSFRGGNGNPGHYEALFGEVDDIISAYEYAASLPYVDPDRIYLGGHSTGGTRALLASEYTDKFRAVICFGAVDDIRYHNNTQFTFDTNIEDEYIVRSPIHWLDNIKSPTFLIEGSEGNSECLTRMEQASQNENIHCFVIDGADHFSVLAPITRLVAQKLAADTGAEPNISITQEELDNAMKQEPVIPVPVMTQRTVESWGLTFSCPYLWEYSSDSDEYELLLYSRYEDYNAWDMPILQISSFTLEEDTDIPELVQQLSGNGYEANEITINGLPAADAHGFLQDDNGESYFQRYVTVKNGSDYVDFTFLVHEDYMEEADILFQNIIDSIELNETE